MSFFSKKDKLPYKIKLVERIQYIADSEVERQKLEARKQEFIEEAKLQLVETANKKIMTMSKWGGLMTESEKEMITEKIKQNPFINIDKDIKIPYYNIRKAIRRAHAY